MDPDVILIHYHELGLKGKNQPIFLAKLVQNIKTATKNHGVEKILNPRGRLVLMLNKNASLDEILKRLAKLPGIANFMPAFQTQADIEELEKRIEKEIKSQTFKTFRITARRADKSFPLDSAEINNRIGEFVLKKTKTRVDLENPKLTIFIEVLSKQIFFHFKKVQGIGGLPSGISGKAVSLLSGGIDSPVSSQMMMKRGLKLVFLHFHSFPYLNRASQDKAKDIAKVLNEYQYGSRLYLVPFGDIQKQITLKVPASYRIIIYRRFMLRIAEHFAKKERARALVTGENLGQVSSQTLSNLSAIKDATGMLILRPLMGMNKEEIIKRAEEIKTYEISIKPDQDCCRLFVPKHPETVGKIEIINQIESKLDISALISEGTKNVEIMDF